MFAIANMLLGGLDWFLLCGKSLITIKSDTVINVI